MAAAGLGYWDGESPGPNTGTSEAEALEAVKLALELGNDVNAVTDFGEYPPLLNADQTVGDARSVMFIQPMNLITSGPAVGDLRWDGSTALHGAAYRGQEDIVQFLVDTGAKLDVKNTLGWTPITVAGGMFVGNTGKGEHPHIRALLRKLMLERGLKAVDDELGNNLSSGFDDRAPK